MSHCNFFVVSLSIILSACLSSCLFVCTVYEAMESYFAENDDEITIKAGERVEVVSKSMDGWWKIR